MSEVAPQEAPSLLGPQQDALSAYRHAAMHPLISLEESDRLGAAIYKGRLSSEHLADADLSGNESYHESNVEAGLQARRIMASHHLQLVMSISRKFASNSEGRITREREAEMIGVGNLALWKCMDGYRHVPGEHFAGFAARCVTNAMIEEMMANIRSATGRSVRMQRKLRAVEAEYRKAQEAGVDISFFEAGEKLGYSQECIQQILSLEQRRLYSLHDLLQYEDGDVTESTLEDPSAQDAFMAVEDEDRINEVWEVAQRLRRQQIITEPEWKVFIGRFRDGLTQKVVGQGWGKTVGQAYISRLEKSVLNKIRQEIEQPGVQVESLTPTAGNKKRAVKLIAELGVPVDEGMDVLLVARTILDKVKITAWQREVMHALIGINGTYLQVKEFAHQNGVTNKAVYDARIKAMRNILAAWGEMSPEEKSAILNTA